MNSRTKQQHGHFAYSTSAPKQASQAKVQGLLDGGFPYSRKLSVHSSCVNALSFSNGDGRWLASAGDDPYVLLWDFYQQDVCTPSHIFRGPRANVFTLAFSATNQYLYSGDTNDTILKYDLTRLTESSLDPGLPESAVTMHSDSVRAISCHPELDAVFLSAGEDGRIILHDSRAEHRMSRAQATLQHTAEFTSTAFHPTVPHIFVTADGMGAVCLRDMRMAFGPLERRARGGVVQTYETALAKSSTPYLSRPEPTSVTFDRTGSKLAVTFLNYFPTIYSLADPVPLAICSGRCRPDGDAVPPGERTYVNTCTMKHGSFGGPGLDSDEYYSAGSDDFCAYVWKVPSVEELRYARETVSADRWQSERSDRIAFTAFPTKDRHIPVDLSTPLARLKGQKSIVNTTLFHPTLPLVLTAGVERHIVIHSPTPTSTCVEDMRPTPTEVRGLPGPSLDGHRVMVRALTSGLDPDDDASTIALFDEILRSEGEPDIFNTRRWDPDSDEEPEEDDSSDDENTGTRALDVDTEIEYLI